MKKYPSHYTGILKPVKEPITIHGRYNPYELDSTFSHLFCNCDNNLFRVFISEYSEVKCVCSICEEEHLVYDASCYPASTGYDPDKGKFNQWVSETGNDNFQVIAIWIYPEYPDHQDDIDWFVMIAVDPETREYIEVVNYQTI